MILSLTIFLSFVVVGKSQTLLYQQSFDVDTSSTADTLEAYPEFDFFGGGSNPVIVSNNQLIVPMQSSGAFRGLSLAGFQTDLLIRVKLTTVPGGPDQPVGVEIGENRMVFHPGFAGTGANPPGSFAVNGPGGFPNRNMGFVPAAGVLHTMEIRSYADFGFYSIKVIDGANPNNVFQAQFSNPSFTPGQAIELGTTGVPGFVGSAIFDDLQVFDIQSGASNFEVAGSSNPSMAGMPDGTNASMGDVAPDQSPVLVDLTPGSFLSFASFGSVRFDPSQQFVGPDGTPVFPPASHEPGAENGIADVTAPLDAVMGVFLDGDQPDLSPAPEALDFSVNGNVNGGLNYVTLNPLLKQPFFIGDGITDAGQQQLVKIPAGATRLFLGTFDRYQWRNNQGSYLVEVIDGPTLPDAFNVFRGSLLDGDLTAVQFSDDNYLRLNPGFTLNSIEAPVWLEFFAIANNSATSLQVESNALTPGLTYTVEAFNYSTTSYEEIGIQTEQFGTDQVVEFTLNADNVDADGSVRTRVGWRQTGFTLNFPWEILVDQIVWN